MKDYKRIKVSRAPALLTGPSPLLLIPLTARNLAGSELKQFAFPLHRNSPQHTCALKSLGSASFVVVQASIDMTLKKEQKLT